jgi:hypothetical protein
MSRSLALIAMCALALATCASARAQDSQAPSPSLGDLARQAQKNKDKEKANKPAAKVLTNDDLPSNSGEIVSAQALENMQSMLDQLDGLDRAALAKNVLQGNNSNFPGRASWEVKLFTAKQSYVSQGRDALQKARQLRASAEGMKNAQDPNDPRVKNMNVKLQEYVRDCVQVGSAFQAVVMEGRDLAAQSASH